MCWSDPSAHDAHGGVLAVLETETGFFVVRRFDEPIDNSSEVGDRERCAHSRATIGLGTMIPGVSQFDRRTFSPRSGGLRQTPVAGGGRLLLPG